MGGSRKRRLYRAIINFSKQFSQVIVHLHHLKVLVGTVKKAKVGGKWVVLRKQCTCKREGGREQPIVLLAIEGWCNYHGAGDEVRMREERSCPPTLHLALL